MYLEGELNTAIMEVGILCVLMSGIFLEKKQELSVIQQEEALIIMVNHITKCKFYIVVCYRFCDYQLW